jgi:hypothetical protein
VSRDPISLYRCSRECYIEKNCSCWRFSDSSEIGGERKEENLLGYPSIGSRGIGNRFDKPIEIEKILF